MALTGSIESYPPTLEDHIASWTVLNGTRPAPLLLKNGQGVAAMVALREEVLDAISAVTSEVQDTKTTSVSRKVLRDEFYIRLKSFRDAAEYWMEGKSYGADLPILPSKTAADDKFAEIGDEFLFAWRAYNADASVSAAQKPLVLKDGTTEADFTAQVLEIRSSKSPLTMAQAETKNTRTERNTLLPDALAMLRLFRSAVRADYGRDSDQFRDLPRLWAENAPKPAAVVLKVTYVQGESKARLDWSAVTDAQVEHLYVFLGPGARFKIESARQLADLLPQINSFELPEGTIVEGSTNWLKIASVLDDGTMVFSNGVKIARGV